MVAAQPAGGRDALTEERFNVLIGVAAEALSSSGSLFGQQVAFYRSSDGVAYENCLTATMDRLREETVARGTRF
jgi:hypothetical protein